MAEKENASSANEARENKSSDGSVVVAHGIGNMQMDISVFPDVLAHTVTRYSDTWDRLAEAFSNPKERASKDTCPLLKLATFGDIKTAKGCLRHEGNLLELTGIEGDYDGEAVTIDQAAARLAAYGIEAILYTSASNGVVNPPKYKGGPRWRVLAPLSRPYPPSEHGKLLAMLDEALGGILAPESYTTELSYYFGRVAGVDFQARRTRGMPIDELDYLFTGTVPAKKAAPAAPIDLPDVLPGEELPALDSLDLAGAARAFLVDGEMNDRGDRSLAISGATAAIYEAVARKYGRQDDALALSLLVHNEHAWQAALDKRGGDADKALEYLWKHHCLKQRGKGVPVVDDFEASTTPAGEPLPKPAYTRTKNGEVLATKENVVQALARPDVCGFQLRHDLFRDEIMLAPGTDQWRAFKDTDYTELCMRLERPGNDFKDISKERIRDAVAYVADANAFDSAHHWLGLQVWDGVERIAHFLPRYFGTDDTPYTRAVGLYIWTALAGRVLSPGIKADMVPVAVGPQGAKKSSTVAAISPAPEFFMELDLDTREADLARLMRGKLVIELGELRGLRKKEQNDLKAFITRTHEHWVPKFREMQTSYARRCVLFGTTNKDEFLADDTGHRRWLPFRAGECDPQGVINDRGQLWAEARELFQAKGIMWADAEQLAEGEHDAYVVHDAWEEIVADWLTTPDMLTEERPIDRPFTAVEALLGPVQMKPHAITQSAKDRMARVLKELGPRLEFAAKRAYINGKRVRAYERTN